MVFSEIMIVTGYWVVLKEVAVTYCTVLFECMPGSTEKSHK
jgi:hypothetical protein